ncbi:MAG TPA: hypothetical protein VF192_11615 [Longimicrobiales bacterium]
MPNALAHFAAQGAAARLTFRQADPKWLLLSCIIPDIPWILQRLNGMLGPVLAPYTMRLYAIVQASLAFSLVLCGALALCSAMPRQVFALLATGAFLHLLLDAAETKWGNGVHLFAPFSWRDLNFGWFWPESGIVLGLTLCGAAFVASEWPRRTRYAIGPARWRPARAMLALSLLATYVAGPLLFTASVEASDSHFVGTLRRGEDRVGQRVGFDRAEIVRRDGALMVRTTGRELITLVGPPLDGARVASIEGTFITPDSVRVARYHRHGGHRDYPSYLGLALLACFWVASIADRRKRRTAAARPRQRSDADGRRPGRDGERGRIRR